MDIDIDLPTTFDPINHFNNIVNASMVKDGDLKKHPVGVYFQTMPTDAKTGLAAIPYDKAEELGFFKIDFLHLSLLDYFESKNEIRTLIKVEPDWLLLQSASVVQHLFQIHRHYEVVARVRPTSIQELADCIALIRPAKRSLMEAYLKDRKNTRPHLYAKPADGKYYFKKGHAIAYALNIVLQLHLIKSGIIDIEHK